LLLILSDSYELFSYFSDDSLLQSSQEKNEMPKFCTEDRVPFLPIAHAVLNFHQNSRFVTKPTQKINTSRRKTVT